MCFTCYDEILALSIQAQAFPVICTDFCEVSSVMSSNRLLLSTCALLLLNACAGSTPQGQMGQPLQNSPRFLGQSAPQPAHRIENLVNQARMQERLAILSGHSPMGPNDTIPERGTVQGRAMTRAYLTQSLEALGYTVEPHAYRNNGTNITARLMAEKPTDEYIVVGAHLDSVKNPGADDNASGSTAVLELATILRELPKRQVNVLFAWFDEEELGLIGSRYLASDLRKQGMKISSMHNIDMLGWDGDGDSAVELAQPDGILWSYYNMVNETHGLKLPLVRTNTGQSDHESFKRNGFHALCISEEYTRRDTTPHYHRRTDTFSTINFDYLASSTRLVAAAVGDLLLKVPPPPGVQFVPHENFPSRPREFHASYDDHIH